MIEKKKKEVKEIANDNIVAKKRRNYPTNKTAVPNEFQQRTASNSKNGFDKEYAKKLLIQGTDVEVIEYFANFGIDQEEILVRRDQFLEKFKGQMFQDDLNNILREFPFVTATNIREIPNYNEYVKFRKVGLSAKDSFKASNSDYIIQGKMKSGSDNSDYSHLSSIGIKGRASKNMPIPEDVLSIWKSAFPKDNLTELTKKYNEQRMK